MASKDQEKPGKDEVLKQLSRIRASASFKSRQASGSVLELLVLQALEGKTLTEKQIRSKLFRAAVYQVQGTLVRTHINKLKHLLRGYYQEEGVHDPVLISLPDRTQKKKADAPSALRLKKSAASSSLQGYPIIVTYNEGVRLLRMANRALAEHSPNSLHFALSTFDLILSQNPGNAAATAGRAECLCIQALYCPESRPVADMIEDALTTASQLFRKDETYLAGRFAYASALLCSFRPTEAFNTFVPIYDPQELRNLWFAAALFLNERIDAATHYALVLAEGRLDDLYALAAYGFYKYLTRDFDEADKIFRSIITLDRHSWIANLGLTFVYLALNHPQDALVQHIYLHKAIIDFDRVVMPGAGLLASNRNDGYATVPDYLLGQLDKLLAAPPERKDWISAAILSIDSAPDNAVASLRLAFRFRHPLVMLAPYWPIFDPLRERDDFKALIAELKTFLK